MTIPQIKDVVKEPDKWLVLWADPWPAMTAGSFDEETIPVEHCTTAANAIKYQRYNRFYNLDDYEEDHSDRDLLLDFIVVHWAELVRKGD